MSYAHQGFLASLEVHVEYLTPLYVNGNTHVVLVSAEINQIFKRLADLNDIVRA